MRLDFDFDANALYVALSDAVVARTVEIDEETFVDLDEAGRPVGIEVIDYGRPWPLAKILAQYELGSGEVEQLRVLFRTSTPSRLHRSAPSAVLA
ncbi:hypothetical protein GCM10027589_05440 [Actinocorallia lasiicapitis]